METNQTVENENVNLDNFEGDVYELIAEFSNSTAEEFGLELRVGEMEKTVIKYDAIAKKVVLDRTESGESFAEEFGTVRKCMLDAEKISFRIFVDVSSVEVFVNNGEEVFTARIFPV